MPSRRYAPKLPSELQELVAAVGRVSVLLIATAGERRDFGDVLLLASLLTLHF